VRENLEFDRDFFEDWEPDWKYFQWWQNKCSYSTCSDEKEEPSCDILQGHETHCLMSQAMKDRISEEAIERMSQYSYIEFAENLKQMLRLTRVLSFT